MCLRMKRVRGLVVNGLVVALFAACGHQAPQRPSQRMGEGPKPDSALMARMNFNRELASAADEQLIRYVQEQDETYALYDAGTWVLILEPGDPTTPTPQPNDEWTVHMRTLDLKGRLLLDSEGTYRIGKNELPMAVDENIRELHHGAKARLIAPWYAAYGLKGTDHVPPYENVIIEIELR